MASIKPRVQVDIPAINSAVDGLVEGVGEITEEVARQMGEEMLREVVQIVQSEFPTSDHKLNETHLEESFTYIVEPGSSAGGWPWTVSLTIKPGVSAGKVAALNYGTEARTTSYTIYPRNVPRALRFSEGVDPSYANKGGKYAGQVLRPYANRTVTSGGIEGRFFMEEAMETVLARHGIDV